MLNLPFLNPYLSFVTPPLPSSLPSPPNNTTRHLIGPSAYPLEVLSSSPAPTSPDLVALADSRPPIVLQHGGFCSASSYSNFLPFLASKGHHVYALSFRGRGGSWRPSFFRMLMTSRDALASEDLATFVKWVRDRHPGKDPVVVGHSAGGGMVQYAIGTGLLGNVEKLVVIGAVPPTGMLSVRSLLSHPFRTRLMSQLQVYRQWLFNHDPFSLPRCLLHLFHPRSPLSTPLLLRNAFFSPSHTPVSSPVVVDCFEREMPIVESMMWPAGLMRAFVTEAEVLKKVTGGKAGKQKVLLIAGGSDVLVTPDIVRHSFDRYRLAASSFPSHDVLPQDDEKADSERETVGYVEIKGSGHHVMLDWQWQTAAELVLSFLDD